jgi:hypothetical protein
VPVPVVSPTSWRRYSLINSWHPFLNTVVSAFHSAAGPWCQAELMTPTVSVAFAPSSSPSSPLSVPRCASSHSPRLCMLRGYIVYSMPCMTVLHDGIVRPRMHSNPSHNVHYSPISRQRLTRRFPVDNGAHTPMYWTRGGTGP